MIKDRSRLVRLDRQVVLDRALDLEMLEWSAKLAAVEALQSGCTAIIDHHESPNAIEGSLDVIVDIHVGADGGDAGQ